MTADLIARLEALPEGSRELDGEVAVIAGWNPMPALQVWECAEEDDERTVWVRLGAVPYGTPDCPWIDSGDFEFEPPAYTTSLDAALTLVPEGWFLRITEIRFGMWRVELWKGDKSVRTKPDVYVAMDTLPLALVVASLIARQESGIAQD